MIKKIGNFLYKCLLVATIPMLIFDIVEGIQIIKNKSIPYLWQNMSVSASVTLPTPISDGQPIYEYCVLRQDSGLAVEQAAGTEVPMNPVSLGPTATEVAPLSTQPEATDTPQPEYTPTFEPTATQPVYDEIADWQVQITDMGKHKESNFHIVVIGVGFTDAAQNGAKLREIISGLEVNFAKVNVDFAYVAESIKH